MSRDQDLMAIEALARLVLDNRLSRLRDVTRSLAQSRAQFAAINVSPLPSDLPAVAAWQVDTCYQRWADIRRAELNAVMARQTASLIEARAEAALAFGKAQALRAIAERQKK